jgi:chromosome segregation ATPase
LRKAFEISGLEPMSISDEQIEAIKGKTYAEALLSDYAALFQAIAERDATIAELKETGQRIDDQLMAADKEIASMRLELAELRKPVAVQRNDAIDQIRQSMTSRPGRLGELLWTDQTMLHVLSAYDALAQDNARWVAARDVWQAEMAGLRERMESAESMSRRHMAELAELKAAQTTRHYDDSVVHEACEILEANGRPEGERVAKGIAAILSASQERERQLATKLLASEQAVCRLAKKLADLEWTERQLCGLLDRLGKYLELRPQIQGTLRDIDDDYVALAASPVPTEGRQIGQMSDQIFKEQIIGLLLREECRKKHVHSNPSDLTCSMITLDGVKLQRCSAYPKCACGEMGSRQESGNV